MPQILQEYEDHIAASGMERDKQAKKRYYLPALRLVAFLLMLISFFNFLIVNDLVFVYGSIAALILFAFLSVLDHYLKLKIEYCDRLIQILRNEIRGINGDFSPFDPGDEYVDPDHSYTYDLDLFGKKSLFHAINRTVTIFGKNRLAEYLKDAFNFKDYIIERQKAIVELSKDPDFRLQLQLVFYGKKSNEVDRIELSKWLDSENKLLQSQIFNSFRYLFPMITSLLIVMSLFGIVVVQLPIMMVVLQLLIVSAYARKTIRVQSLLSSKVGTISKYAQFLLLVEKGRFKSSYLVELTQQLSHDGIEPPSKIIRKLFRLLSWMDTNLNILVSTILNGLFLFNLHVLAEVEKWKEKYREDIPRWFATIGEIDALASLANFAANNPEFIFPVPIKDQFLFEAINLGHPLISKDECVTNDISINGWNQYCIITGANMSGKSTFLRTVGTNYVMAMLGASVYATKFIFCPVVLHSSIRTNDSLARKESFFYAELKRLKQIILELETGQRTFILLDEILKGTNSKDKQVGSVALLEQLTKYQSVGLIATHDLILGDLVKDYPDNIHNLCFEIQIIEDNMNIDYKLQEGVCKNLNATFLMKKMGIIMDS